MAARYDDHDGRLRGSGLQARRLRKWTKAGGLCANCGALTNYADPRTDPQGFHLDHILMLHTSKDDTEANTQVLCAPCHEIKTAADMGHRERIAIGEDGWPVQAGGGSF